MKPVLKKLIGLFIFTLIAASVFGQGMTTAGMNGQITDESGETLIGAETFGVILADDLCVGETDSVMSQMINLYQKMPACIIAIEEVPMDEVYKYGVIAADKIEEGVYQVNGMVEKPSAEDAPSNLAIIGRYILLPEIFDTLRSTPPGKNGELQITDALHTLAKQGKVLGLKFKGRRFDCGSVDGFVEATNYFYNDRYGS
jgi:UTP--glucose-1-phosphate uridylyltransferase